MANKIDELNDKIKKTQDEYMERSFTYDSESDAGYKEYTRLMRENGKRAMDDTVGRASALTGGYANSYAVAAGQQAYDEYAEQAAAAQATYRQLARDEFDAENQAILDRLAMMKDQKSAMLENAALGAQYGDYSKYVDLGIYDSEDVAKKALGAAPNDKQVAYAKDLFAKHGISGLNTYIDSLDVGNADSLLDEVLKDFENQFKVTDDGGTNHLGGLDRNATLKLGDREEDVADWYQILQDEYGYTADQAYQLLMRVQDNPVSEEED